jgi:hypothetical protein
MRGTLVYDTSQAGLKGLSFIVLAHILLFQTLSYPGGMHPKAIIAAFKNSGEHFGIQATLPMSADKLTVILLMVEASIIDQNGHVHKNF